MFTWGFEQYGQATEEEIIENTAALLEQWSLHKEIEKLIDRFDKALTYASFAKQGMTNGILCTYFLTVIKITGKYTCTYENWTARYDNRKTWAHLKDFLRVESLKCAARIRWLPGMNLEQIR